MTDPVTTNLGLTKPTVGADADAWGGLVNGNADLIDAEFNRVARGDANYVIAATDRNVALTAALSAPRTFTMPAASAVKTGQAITFIDEAGGVNATNTLTFARAGADRIDSANSFVVDVARTVIRFRSDGASKWTTDSARCVTDLTVSRAPVFNGGTVLLANGTSNVAVWSSGGVGAPAVASRSAGTKLVLYPSLNASLTDFGFGIESNALWASVAGGASVFKWYAGTTRIAQLSGAGALALDMPNTAGLVVGGGTSPSRYMAVNDSGQISARFDNNALSTPIACSNLQITGAGQGTGVQFYINADGVNYKDAGGIFCRTLDDFSTSAKESTVVTVNYRDNTGTPRNGFQVGATNLSFTPLAPASDNTVSLGNPTSRWTTLYAVTGAINTSDARQKAVRGEPSADELMAWSQVRPMMFQWKASVAAKGADAARLHAGYVAQEVQAAFGASGLDAGDYGLWRRDEAADGAFTLGLRYEQCLVLETALLRSRLAALEDRVAALEGAR